MRCDHERSLVTTSNEFDTPVVPDSLGFEDVQHENRSSTSI